jgi:protein phosphatase
VRAGLLVLALLVVLGGGLYLGYRYTQNQYYVGATDAGQLAIFRGVPGQIAGLNLSTVSETSNTSLGDLTSVAQDRVKQGIQADSRPDAKKQLAELTSNTPSNPNLKPVCTPASAVATDAPALPSTPPSVPGSTPASSPSGTSASAPATAPATVPLAQPSDSTSPDSDPVGCRPVG